VLDKDVSGERLARIILQVYEQPEKRRKMENNCYALGKRDATEKALELCLALMNKSHGESGSNKTAVGENELSCF